MRQLWKVICAEWKYLIQKNSPAWFFLTPIIFCLAFGFIYSENTVRNIPTAILDSDQSKISRSLIQIYDDSERFNVMYYPTTVEEMEELLREGIVKVGLEIPKNFSRDIKLSQGTEIALVVNSENNMFANAALSAGLENNRTFSVGLSTKLIEGLGVLPSAAQELVYPVKVGVRILGNPTTGYTSFMLSGLILNGVQIALLVTVTPILAAKKLRTAENFSPFVLMLGKAVPYFFLGLMSYTAAIFGSVNFWAVPMKGDWISLLILGGAFIFAVICILYLFSACSPDATMALQLPLLYIMPGLLYSGLSFPNFSMEGFGRWYSEIMPMTHAADCLRDLLLAGNAPTLQAEIFTLIKMGLAAGFIAFVIFSIRRSRQ